VAAAAPALPAFASGATYQATRTAPPASWPGVPAV